jgi:hypothetical protein
MTLLLKEKKLFSFAEYLCNYPSTLFLGYSSAVGYARYSCSGLAVVGVDGEGLLFGGVSVAV